MRGDGATCQGGAEQTSGGPSLADKSIHSLHPVTQLTNSRKSPSLDKHHPGRNMTLPWEVHEDLTAERLITVAQLIAKGRADAVEWHNPAIGDDDWVLGCRAFNATRYQISREAKSGACPWLTMADESKHFVFRVGDVPTRFYRGDPEDPNHRTRRQSFPELAQLSIAFPEDDVRDLVYRFAVETDLDGQAVAISFVALLGDTVHLNWSIPIAVAASTVELLAERALGVELDPPVVTDGKRDKKNEAGAA